MAEKLGSSVDELLGTVFVPEPVVAYRTRLNRATTGPARQAGEEVGRHLRELLQYVECDSLFEPPVLRSPNLDEAYIQQAAAAVRMGLGLSPTDVVGREQLFALFREFGCVPCTCLMGRG